MPLMLTQHACSSLGVTAAQKRQAGPLDEVSRICLLDKARQGSGSTALANFNTLQLASAGLLTVIQQEAPRQVCLVVDGDTDSW